MPRLLIGALVVGLLVGAAWVATGQKTYLRAWAAWTVFCLILFPALVAARGDLNPRTLLAAALLAPVAAALGALRHAGLARRVRIKRGMP